MYRRAEQQVRAFHAAEEGMDDVHGILGLRKDTAVLLEDEGDAGGFEPAPGVFVRELFQQALHEPVAAGIGLREIPDAGEGICEVTAASARDGDLRQGLGPGLVHIDTELRPQPPEFGGAEATGGTGSYDSDPFHAM